MRSLARRLEKLEADRLPKPARIPHVLEVRFDETFDEALARFIERWGRPSRGHHFLVVPEQASTPEEIAASEIRSYVRQTALIAEMHRRYPTPQDESRYQ